MKQEPIQNLIVIHPNTLRKFMNYKKEFANLLALYSFYLYHAKNQKTNQPLATDEFTKRGMNWALDRVKKTKKILKEMKLIEVVQKKRYSYVHIFFIYTKEKVKEIFEATQKEEKKTEVEALAPKKEKLKPSIPSDAKTVEIDKLSPMLKKWVEYCTQNKIRYNVNNIKNWEEKLKDRLSIEQQKAIYTSMGKKWKDFYIVPIEKSDYHHLLGQSLMMDKDCDTLLDIGYSNEKYTYQFKNIKVTSKATPSELFKEYGYLKEEIKTAPISSKVQNVISGIFKKF